ncbi:MAG: outer spore coat protein CotE [Firmicutes bacterium]|nr:outer spore coat protein CotE [Bacillota bacterium]
MANYREIVTKAVIGKGKKTFITTDVITPEIVPTTILGCWVINHNFKGYKTANKIKIDGSYDVNIWYSCLDDTKTEVVKKSITYAESVVVPKKDEASTINEEVIIRSLKQPTCTRAEIVNGKIEYTIEKELGIELVGDTKVKIAYDEEEDPWDVITDEEIEQDIKNIDKQIEEQVNEEYLD